MRRNKRIKKDKVALDKMRQQYRLFRFESHVKDI